MAKSDLTKLCLQNSDSRAGLELKEGGARRLLLSVSGKGKEAQQRSGGAERTGKQEDFAPKQHNTVLRTEKKAQVSTVPRSVLSPQPQWIRASEIA